MEKTIKIKERFGISPRRDDILICLVIVSCVVWIDRQLLSFTTPILLANRDNVDIVYPQLRFFISGLRHGEINFYQPFQWAGTRLFGDPNFQINLVEIVVGVLFDAKAALVSLNFLWLLERIVAALGMYALIGALCRKLPAYVRAILALVYVFSLGYCIAESFTSTSLEFATAPWLLFVLVAAKRLSNVIAFGALTAVLFVQFSYGQLQFTVYLGWLLLSFAAFYLPRSEKFRGLLLLSGAACVAALLSAYYVVPLVDNLFFNDGGAGGRVAHAFSATYERVPFFYLTRLFVPQIFGWGVPWWPAWTDGWTSWEAFSAFQGVVLSFVVVFGLFVRRVPLYFKLIYLFIALTATFRPGLLILHIMNLGTSVPYGRQTVFLGLIAPMIAGFVFQSIAENRRVAVTFAVWCGFACVGLLMIYVFGFPEWFVKHAYGELQNTHPGTVQPGEAERFYNLYAHAMQRDFGTPSSLLGLSATLSVALAIIMGRPQWHLDPRIPHGIVALICLFSLGQAVKVYQTAELRIPSDETSGPLSLDVRNPAEIALINAGAQVRNGPVEYRMHPDIYFGEHRQGTKNIGGQQIFHLRGAKPQENRFRTLPNFLASEDVPVTTGYSSLIPQAQRFTELMMWTPRSPAMERAIGDRTRLHPALLEALAIKWVLRHQPSLIAALKGRPDWSDDRWEQRFLSSSKLVYSDNAYRLYEYLDARPAIDIPRRIVFGANAVAALSAMEDIDKPWIPTAALPIKALGTVSPDLRSRIRTERGEKVVYQSGSVLKTSGLAGHWMRLSVAAARPAILLLGIKFDHWWSVHVNGRPAPLIRANDVFSAVQIPAGSSEVLVQLRPRSAWIGLSLSALTFVSIILGFIIVWLTQGANWVSFTMGKWSIVARNPKETGQTDLSKAKRE